MTTNSTPLKPNFGIMIEGASQDIINMPDDEFRSLFYKNKLLIIRGSQPKIDDFYHICSKIGRTMTLEEYAEGRDAAAPAIVDGKAIYYSVFSNKTTGIGTGPMLWHKDNCNRGSISYPVRSLLMVNCPNTNAGFTQFLDTDTAWSRLDQSLRDKWLSCKVEQHSWYVPGTELEVFPSMKQHPVTGAILPRLNSCGNDGWISDLLDENNNRLGCQLALDITKAMEKIEDAVYTHKWQVGDIIMFDNYYFLHTRTALEIEPHQERLMWRINSLHDETRPVSIN